MWTTSPLLDLGMNELDAAAQAAHDVRTRLTMVQKILLDIPQAVTVNDVTELYAAYHAAEALERGLSDLRARLTSAVDEGTPAPR